MEMTIKQLANELGVCKQTVNNAILQVTYSPAYASLRGGGFSLKYSNLYSINELSPCVPRL